MKKLIRRIISFEITSEYMGLAGGIFTVLISLLSFWATFSYRKNTYSMSKIGPVSVPRFVCYVIFALGVLQIVKWILGRKNMPAPAKKEAADDSKPLDKMLVFRRITPICSFALIALYIHLMKEIGFTIASTIYITVQVPLLSVDMSWKRFLKSFILGVIVSVLVYLLFAKGFQLHLPKNSLGF